MSDPQTSSKGSALREGLKSAKEHRSFTAVLVAALLLVGGVLGTLLVELEEVWEGEDDDDDDGNGNGGVGVDVVYEPIIDPSAFVEGVDNRFMPLVPGTMYIYEASTEDGKERIEVFVTNDTRVVMGVTCVVVHDTVKVDGVLVEDTYDWYAQDADGNVWYFGEDSKEYEDGKYVGTSGSWEGGVDGAKPGIYMWANPMSGVTYRQEYYEGEAEDMAEVLTLKATATVPHGTYTNVLRTRDWNPLEPGFFEEKYYAEGVGMVLEVMVKGGSERVELIEVRTD